MASTNKTTNYDLSQYVGSDKPTYLGDYNSDMQKIDAQMKVNENNANIAKTDADLALANAETAQETANTASGTAETANTTANNALELGAENQAQLVELDGKFDNQFKTITRLGVVSNATQVFNLTDDALSNYKFLLLESGYGYNKAITLFPTAFINNTTAQFNQMMTYVKTYNSADFVSVNFISDTSFRINGSVGVDTQTKLYGVK